MIFGIIARAGLLLLLIASKVSFANIDTKSHDWVVDSSVNHHMVPHRDYFKIFVTFSTPHPVYLGDNRPTNALGII